MVFATQAHTGVYRKVGNIPYILHPMEVAVITGTMTKDLDVISAALLHDTIEDTYVTADMLRENFGERITQYVLSETENKHPELPASDTWKLRKEESLSMLRSTEDINVKILWLADKLSNLRSFRRQFRKDGAAMWNNYNQKDPAEHEWYYRSIIDCMDELKDTDAMREMRYLFKVVFGSAI